MPDQGRKSSAAPSLSNQPNSACLPQTACLAQAIEKLKSLHYGDQGLLETVTHGWRAVPPLRALLYKREPSGIFQPRCRVVQALVILKAYDVLAEFLATPREAADPVERIGDEVVINRAARALGGLHELHAFELLMWLAETNPLPGVMAALGGSGRVEAIPYLVAALAEDESRLAAETSLRNFGLLAHQALAVAACRSSDEAPESESRLRQRRSALGLLSETGVRPELWPVLRKLMQDRDTKISVLACKICLKSASEPERRGSVLRLRSLLRAADFLLKEEIESCLAIHFGRSAEQLERERAAKTALFGM
ncbi:MAG TPA: hypothetical protein VME69_02515 [Methylocella sp.]|nr:hypothetical protein [Methylocella sp.]